MKQLHKFPCLTSRDRRLLVRAALLLGVIRLGRKGYPACLRIGVSRGEGGRLQAHAWVESQGKIVVGSGARSHYTPLAALEGERP